MPHSIECGFVLLVTTAILIDLVLAAKNRDLKFRDALIWTFIWVGLAFFFNAAVYFYMGRTAAMQFLAGYLIEQSLSVDNLFVFLLIFSYFHVPKKFQRKILFWGIFGAVVMRAVFIVGGIALIHRFHWIMYIFGLLLIFTGIRMGFEGEKKIEPEKNPVLRFCRKILPMTENDEKGSLLIRKGKKLFATPLMIVLIVVETTDVIFAIDSIPAIFGITLDRFIVFTSNIFAILGLRSLYFVLAGAMENFHRLSVGLAIILTFVGLKMLAADYFEISITWSLVFIVLILAASITASILWPEEKKKRSHSDDD